MKEKESSLVDINEEKNNKKRNYKLNKTIFRFKKRGFTLIELLAIIVILAIILVVTIPNILSSISGAKEKSEQIFIKSIEKGILGYTDYYADELIVKEQEESDFNIVYKKLDNKNLTFNDLVEKKIFSSLENPNGNRKCNLDDVEIQLYKDGNKYYYQYKLDCIGRVISTIPTIANKPVLEGLTPIKYDEDKSKWVVTTKSDRGWYDYDNQKWANAAILKSGVSREPGTELTDLNNQVYAMFVWIPRFSYTFGCQGDTISQDKCLGYKINGASDLTKATPGAIDIKFTSTGIVDELETGVQRPAYLYSSTDTEEQRLEKVSKWMTHPAFWWDKDGDGERDSDEELSGIWVGKFETGGANEAPIILPNVKSLKDQNVGTQFATARKFITDPVYGLDDGKTDPHMMKNSEWGAVAYLSQSKYGKYGNANYDKKLKEIYKNNSSCFYTGRSQGTAPGTSDTSCSGTYNYDKSKEGTGASTTGNIYGIYDMVGGSDDRVMGNYNYKSEYISGFSDNWLFENSNKKYFDSYTSLNQLSLTNETDIKEVLGHALYETKDWYNDSITPIANDYPWFTRGGYYYNPRISGAFGTFRINGSNNPFCSFRVSITVMN